MPTQTGSIDFKSTKGFQSYASGQYTTKTEFNNLEIGGRNLLYDTSEWSKWAKTSKATDSNGVLTCTNTDTSSGFQRANGWFTLGKADLLNREMVVSFDAMKTDATDLGTLCFQLFTTSAAPKSVTSGNIAEGARFFTALSSTPTNATIENAGNINSSTWTRVSVKFTPSKVLTGNYTDMAYLAVYVGIRNAVGSAQFRRIKAEFGNKATDWTPAPEDTTDRIVKAETAIEQTTNNVLIKATQSDTTAAQGGQHLIESLINVAPIGVKIAASKVEIDGTAVFKAANAIPDTRNDNQPPSWYFTNYPKQSVTEFKTSSVMGLTGETYCYVTTVTGWSDASGGYPKQTAQIGSKTYWRVGVSASAWSAWQETESTSGSQEKVDALEIGGRNLYAFTNASTGYIRSSTPYGDVVLTPSSPQHTTSDYIPVSPGDVYTVQLWNPNLITNSANSNRTVCWYNSSKEYISIQSATGDGNGSRPNGALHWSFTLEPAPENAAYARFGFIIGPSTNTVDTDIKVKVEKGNKATDWTPAPEDVGSSIDSVYDKIRSQGIQLVTNGNGFMGDNTNWPGLRFDGSKANGSPGSFTKSVGYTTIFSEEAFPVDVSKEYLFEFDAMSDGGTGVLYSFLATLDSDKNLIDAFHVMYYQNTLTTLASDLNPGDTTVKLTSAANFATTTATHQRTLTFWDYSNSSGYTYPAETYSRNVYSNIYADDSKVDKSTGVITLKSAWTGPKKTAGTQVSQGHSGSTYNYSHIGIKIPSTWTHYSALISGLDTVKNGSDAAGKFRQGTAFGKVGFLWNYNNSNQGQIWVTNISVKEASANLSSSVKRTQRIWYRKSAAGAPATPGTASSNWVVKPDDGTNAWTKMHVSITDTEKFIYTCEQYEMGDGTVGYTSVLLDNTITVIDGGAIITGSVTATQIAAGTITGEEIAANTIDGNNIKGSTITAEHLSSAFSLDLGKVEGLKERLESVEQGVSGVQTNTQWVHFDQSVGTVFGREGSANNVTITDEGINFNTDEGRAAWATGGVFHANEMEADTVDTRTVVMGDWAIVQSGSSFYIDYIGS